MHLRNLTHLIFFFFFYKLIENILEVEGSWGWVGQLAQWTRMSGPDTPLAHALSLGPNIKPQHTERRKGLNIFRFVLPFLQANLFTTLLCSFLPLTTTMITGHTSFLSPRFDSQHVTVSFFSTHSSPLFRCIIIIWILFAALSFWFLLRVRNLSKRRGVGNLGFVLRKSAICVRLQFWQFWHVSCWAWFVTSFMKLIYFM